MYAIAFFTTVILFSASLYVGNKLAEACLSHQGSTDGADLHISLKPHFGHYRHSA